MADTVKSVSSRAIAHHESPLTRHDKGANPNTVREPNSSPPSTSTRPTACSIRPRARASRMAAVIQWLLARRALALSKLSDEDLEALGLTRLR